MTGIGAHGNTLAAPDAVSRDTHETAPHDSQRASQSDSHVRTQHGNAHQRAAKQQSAKVHAAQVAKTKLNALHAQQRAKAARRVQIVAFYRNHKFATVAAGKAASVAAQKMLRQFGERPRPTTAGRALAHKRGHARGESHGELHGELHSITHEAEHASTHAHLAHLHAGEHAHDQREAHPHPKHPPHRHRDHGQHREGREHEQEQGRHADTESEDAPEPDQKHAGEHERESGRGQNDDQHQEQGQEQGQGQGQEQKQGDENSGQDQGQNQGQDERRPADRPHARDSHERRRADGVHGFAKASRRSVLSANGMAAASRATAPKALQAWAREHRGAMDLSERLAERYAHTLVNVAPRLEFGAAMAPLLLLSLLSPMSAARDAARFASQRAAALASTPPDKASITSALLGHAEDANAARQASGMTFTDAQQSLTAVKQWLMAASVQRDTAVNANVDAVSSASAGRNRGVAASVQRRVDSASHNTLNVRVSGPADDGKP